MESSIEKVNWNAITNDLANAFAERAAKHDQAGDFVADNYADLKASGYQSLTIPEELGGYGVSHSEMCNIIKRIGKSCGSTALAMTMHNHLLAANIWKYKKGQGGEKMLEKVAREQLVLISTGAKDWLASNGELVKVENGYRLSGLKHFASQSAYGDVIVTSAQFNDPENGMKVLHFPVPMKTEGVSHLNNWNTMGMRGTGSHTIKFDNVFVPEGAIVLSRNVGEFHPVWNVVLTVAMPLIMSAYVGIAERAVELVVEKFRQSSDVPPHIVSQIGALQNMFTHAKVMWEDMVRIANDLDFEPTDQNGNDILIRKTAVANAVIQTVSKAFEINGGQSYFKNQEMERLFRDIQGARFHPLSETEQLKFTGEYILKQK